MWRARNRPEDRFKGVDMTEEDSRQNAADMEKERYFRAHPNAPLDEYQTEEDGDESKAARDRVVADMKAQKEFQDRQKRITEHVRFLDSLGLVDRDYTMSSSTETVFFADELKPGLVVLLENPDLRAENPKPDSGPTIFAQARKNNRWCTIVNIRTSKDDGYVSFIAQYEDGSESLRVSRPHDGWLVKLDSIIDAEPYATLAEGVVGISAILKNHEIFNEDVRNKILEDIVAGDFLKSDVGELGAIAEIELLEILNNQSNIELTLLEELNNPLVRARVLDCFRASDDGAQIVEGIRNKILEDDFPDGLKRDGELETAEKCSCGLFPECVRDCNIWRPKS